MPAIATAEPAKATTPRLVDAQPASETGQTCRAGGASAAQSQDVVQAPVVPPLAQTPGPVPVASMPGRDDRKAATTALPCMTAPAAAAPMDLPLSSAAGPLAPSTDVNVQASVPKRAAQMPEVQPPCPSAVVGLPPGLGPVLHPASFLPIPTPVTAAPTPPVQPQHVSDDGCPAQRKRQRGCDPATKVQTEQTLKALVLKCGGSLGPGRVQAPQAPTGAQAGPAVKDPSAVPLTSSWDAVPGVGLGPYQRAAARASTTTVAGSGADESADAAVGVAGPGRSQGNGTKKYSKVAGMKGVAEIRLADGRVHFQAYISLWGHRFHLGTYSTLEEASKMYDRASIQERGWEDAIRRGLNYPPECYPELRTAPMYHGTPTASTSEPPLGAEVAPAVQIEGSIGAGIDTGAHATAQRTPYVCATNEGAPSACTGVAGLRTMAAMVPAPGVGGGLGWGALHAPPVQGTAGLLPDVLLPLHGGPALSQGGVNLQAAGAHTPMMRFPPAGFLPGGAQAQAQALQMLSMQGHSPGPINALRMGPPPQGLAGGLPGQAGAHLVGPLPGMVQPLGLAFTAGKPGLVGGLPTPPQQQPVAAFPAAASSALHTARGCPVAVGADVVPFPATFPQGPGGVHGLPSAGAAHAPSSRPQNHAGSSPFGALTTTLGAMDATTHACPGTTVPARTSCLGPSVQGSWRQAGGASVGAVAMMPPPSAEPATSACITSAGKPSTCQPRPLPRAAAEARTEHAAGGDLGAAKGSDAAPDSVAPSTRTLNAAAWGASCLVADDHTRQASICGQAEGLCTPAPTAVQAHGCMAVGTAPNGQDHGPVGSGHSNATLLTSGNHAPAEAPRAGHLLAAVAGHGPHVSRA